MAIALTQQNYCCQSRLIPEKLWSMSLKKKGRKVQNNECENKIVAHTEYLGKIVRPKHSGSTLVKHE